MLRTTSLAEVKGASALAARQRAEAYDFLLVSVRAAIIIARATSDKAAAAVSVQPCPGLTSLRAATC